MAACAFVCKSYTQKFYKLLLNSIDADLFAVSAHALKLHFAVNQGKQRIIRTTANVVAGVDVRAALLDEDVARKDKLAVRPLRAKALGLGITAVTGGAHSLFMCEQLQVYFKHFVHLRISL